MKKVNSAILSKMAFWQNAENSFRSYNDPDHDAAEDVDRGLCLWVQGMRRRPFQFFTQVTKTASNNSKQIKQPKEIENFHELRITDTFSAKIITLLILS